MNAYFKTQNTLQWRHNERGGVSNHRLLDCLLNRLFRRRWKTSKLCVNGLCEGNSPVTSEFPSQRASYAENVSIWWRHHLRQPVTFTNDTKFTDVYTRRQASIMELIWWTARNSYLFWFEHVGRQVGNSRVLRKDDGVECALDVGLKEK